MPEISIIVPVYNVEKYIRKCIESILNQTFSDFELILVDDGSTDNSGKICDEYKLKDDRIIVIHKKNGGLSSARNVGIDKATGKFLGFVDSDDYIEKDMYETLYNDIKEFDADISVCQVYDEYNNSCNPRTGGTNAIKRCILDNTNAFKLAMIRNMILVASWNKLYKKELFENYRYPNGKTFEDAFVTPMLIFNSKRISYNPLPKYFYVHRENSITTLPFSQSDLCVIEAYTNIRSFVNKNIPELNDLAQCKYLWAYMVVLDKIMISDDFNDKALYHEILNKINSNLFYILKNDFFAFKRKLALIALKIHPKIYKLIIRALHKRMK